MKPDNHPVDARRKMGAAWGLTALLVIGALVGLLPSADALTWTQTTLRVDTGATNEKQSMVALGPTKWVVGLALTSSVDFAIVKTTDGGASWGSPIILDTGADAGLSPEGAVPVGSSNDAYFCYEGGGNIRLTFTHDAALSWSTNTAGVDDSAGTPIKCAVWAISDTKVGVVYQDSVDSKFHFALSSDGGGTFAGSVIVYNTGVGVAATSPAIGWKNSTHAVVVIPNSGTSTRSCSTTNQGSTWTCAASTIPTVATPPKRVHWLGSGDQYVFGWMLSTGPTMYVVKTVNSGTSWSLITAGTPTAIGGAASATGTGGLAVIDSTRWAAFMGWSQTVVCNGASIVTYQSTDDGGVTWSTQETAIDGASSCDGLVGVDTAPLDTAKTATIDVVVSCGCFSRISGNNRATEAEGHALFQSTNLPTDATTDAFPGSYQLVGWDVNPSGTALIARLYDGTDVEKIHSYSAIDLGTPLDTFDEPYCGIAPVFDGVAASNAASQTLVAWFGCASVTGTTRFLDFGSYSDLGSFTPTTTCEDCPQSIDLTSVSNPLDDGPEFHEEDFNELQQFPIGWGNTQNSLFGSFFCGTCSQGFLGWTFTSDRGHIGAASYVSRESQEDFFEEHHIQVSGVSPSQICTWIDQGKTPANHVYLGTATQDGPTTVRPVHYTQVNAGAGQSAELHNEFLGTLWSNSALSGATGISCAGDLVAVYKGNDSPAKVWLVHATLDTSRPVDERPGGSPVGWAPEGITLDAPVDGVFRGVALSQDSTKMAYLDGDSIKFRYTSNGTLLSCSIDPDTGYYGMEFSGAAQHLWVAYQDHADRHQLFGSDHCAVPVASDTGSDSGLPGSTPTPTPVSVGDLSVAIDNFLGSALGLSILIIVILAVLGAYLGRKFNNQGTGAMLGATLGFAFGAATGGIPVLVTFIVVVLAGLVFYLRGR